MEIQVRRGNERGHFDHGWLRTFHTFSFADYYDPKHMGFRSLRVINEDFVEAGEGFPTHGHRDMEIITYVLDGAVAHKDSMGNGSTIKPGEIQRMSAGTGVRHSEMNASKADELHLLQIWIVPDREGYPPSYEQKAIAPERVHNALALVAAPGGGDGAVELHQDAKLYAARLEPGHAVTHDVAPARHAWVQVARGTLEVAGQTLAAGDGLAARGPGALELRASEDAEVLVFDLG